MVAAEAQALPRHCPGTNSSLGTPHFVALLEFSLSFVAKLCILLKFNFLKSIYRHEQRSAIKAQTSLSGIAPSMRPYQQHATSKDSRAETLPKSMRNLQEEKGEV